MQRAGVIGEQLVIAHVFDSPEQGVVVVNIPVRFPEISCQHPPRALVLVGKAQHRRQPAAVGVMHAGGGAMLVIPIVQNSDSEGIPKLV